MISVLTLAFRKYLETPFEDFTSKIILALSIFEILEKYDKNDLDRLQYIETNTNKNICVSLYKLDRVVNPSKGEFNVTDTKFKFKRNDEEEDVFDDNIITLTENQIQKYLCVAIREVNQIIFRNLKPYKIEHSMDENNEIQDDELGEILN